MMHLNLSNLCTKHRLFLFSKHSGDFFLDKNYFLEESDYLSGKLPDKISS